jgi:hypothetical protein
MAVTRQGRRPTLSCRPVTHLCTRKNRALLTKYTYLKDVLVRVRVHNFLTESIRYGTDLFRLIAALGWARTRQAAGEQERRPTHYTAQMYLLPAYTWRT